MGPGDHSAAENGPKKGTNRLTSGRQKGILFFYWPRRGAARLARQAHNLEVVGSNPTAATRKPLGIQGFCLLASSADSLFSAVSGSIGAKLVPEATFDLRSAAPQQPGLMQIRRRQPTAG